MMKVSFFSKSILTAGVSLALALTFSCSSNNEDDNDDVGKGDDISNYRTVKIGEQTWMAENLNYNVKGSKCYDNDPANCEKYGRLYDWAIAMALPSSCNNNDCSSQIKAKHQGICSTGWHIPTNDEWETLSAYVENAQNCSDCGAKYLKATSGWYNDDDNGQDTYEFAALPGGYGFSGGGFGNVGNFGIWWSATEREDVSYSYFRYMDYNNAILQWYGFTTASSFLSVRCIQD